MLNQNSKLIHTLLTWLWFRTRRPSHSLNDRSSRPSSSNWGSHYQSMKCTQSSYMIKWHLSKHATTSRCCFSSLLRKRIRLTVWMRRYRFGWTLNLQRVIKVSCAIPDISLTALESPSMFQHLTAQHVHSSWWSEVGNGEVWSANAGTFSEGHTGWATHSNDDDVSDLKGSRPGVSINVHANNSRVDCSGKIDWQWAERQARR